MIQLKNILVAFDGSETGLKVLDAAKKLTEDNDAQLTVAYVHGEPLEHPVNIGTTSEGEEFMFQYMGTDLVSTNSPMIPADQKVTIVEEEIPNQVIATAESQLIDLPGVTYKKLVGKPSEEIVKFATNNDTDLIVIGNRGIGAFKRLVMGSVSQKVANDSECSVFVVK